MEFCFCLLSARLEAVKLDKSFVEFRGGSGQFLTTLYFSHWEQKVLLSNRSAFKKKYIECLDFLCLKNVLAKKKSHL